MKEVDLGKIVVLKTGESETFIKDDSGVVSLGDIIRTRVLLASKYRDQFFWCTSEAGKNLLKYDIDTKFLDWDDIFREKSFGTKISVLNLEKNISKFEILKKRNISCFGLVYDKSEWKIKTIYNEVFEIEAWRIKFDQIWSNMLLGIIETDNISQIEPPLLELPFKNENVFRFGLNHLVGSKWENKTYSSDFWSKLSNILGAENVSWQQGEKKLEDYMKWICSCETIVTHDSLGLHLGMALGKKIIALYRSTSPKDIIWKEGDRYYILDNNYSEEKILELIKNEFK